MHTNIYWRTAYEAAVQEIDSSKLAEKVHSAKEAIFARLRTMPIAEHQERLAMQKALTALDNLVRDRLGELA